MAVLPAVLSLFLATEVGFASQTAAQSPKAPAQKLNSTPPNTFEYKQLAPSAKRDFSTTYQRANESISIHSAYLIGNLAILKDSKDDHGKGLITDQQWDQAVRERIGAFCNSGESSSDCYSRHNDIQSQVLAQMKSDLLQNRAQVSQLNSTGSKGISYEVSASVEPHPALYAARASTVPELQAKYKAEMARLGILTSQQYEDWVRSIRRAPRKEDFVMFKAKKTAAGSMLSAQDIETELDRSCGDEICYDSKKFQAALDEYQVTKDASGKTFEDRLKEHETQMLTVGTKATPKQPFVGPTSLDAPQVSQKKIDIYQDVVDQVDRQIASDKKTNPNTSLYISIDPETVRLP